MKVLLVIASALYLVCGSEPAQERLVGGEIAFSGEFPFHVSLRLNNNHRCGGSLVTDQHVLTAAHCLVNYLPGARNARKRKGLTVVARTTNLILKGDVYRIGEIYPHEKYEEKYVENDIGLIKLDRKVKMSRKVRPAELSNVTDIPDGSKLVMVGFGSFHSGDPVANQDPVSLLLRKVEIKKISLRVCQRKWGYFQTVFKTNVCTSTAHRVGSCIGDSGGPVLYEDKLQGIVSYGEAHCAYGVPDVHTNVALYLDWIEETIARSIASPERSKAAGQPKPAENGAKADAEHQGGENSAAEIPSHF